ncbi:MAG TPA: alpha/beta hydrolase [Pirellulales bacterium]|nr:alpha/beta hydrolase [Pirellulales bacterium]
MKLRRHWLSVLVLCLSVSTYAQAPKTKAAKLGARMPETVVFEQDIVYGRAGERELHLDMVRPKEAASKPLPVVAFIHGGGWRNGSKQSGIANITPLVATGNYLGVSIEYRLTGEAIWPAQINDCKAAIRWLRANATQYKIDPDHIGVWGNSAGGHLVSLLGTSGEVAALEGDNGSIGYSSRVNCVVDYCGPSDFLALMKSPRAEAADSSVALLLGGPLDEKQELAKQASPVTYVSADDPPFLIVHGTKDPLVPMAQAETLAEALKQAGVPVTFVVMEGGGHGIRGPEITARVHSFFEKNLRGQSVDVSADPIVVAESD